MHDRAQTVTPSDVGTGRENVAESDVISADARAVTATAQGPGTNGPSTISAEADGTAVDQFEAASLAINAMRETNADADPRYVDVAINNKIKRMTMKHAFEYVSKRALFVTVNVADSGADFGCWLLFCRLGCCRARSAHLKESCERCACMSVCYSTE